MIWLTHSMIEISDLFFPKWIYLTDVQYECVCVYAFDGKSFAAVKHNIELTLLWIVLKWEKISVYTSIYLIIQFDKRILNVRSIGLRFAVMENYLVGKKLHDFMFQENQLNQNVYKYTESSIARGRVAKNMKMNTPYSKCTSSSFSCLYVKWQV